MNQLKTYRNFVLINKLLDLVIYLIIFAVITTFVFICYYATKSIFVLILILTIIYLISYYIAKLFEKKVLVPSIIYIVISIILILYVWYYEEGNVNLELTDFLLSGSIFLFISALLMTLYKYETPISIYYKTKDYFSAVSYGKKIKRKFLDNKNPTTETPYSTNLFFEKNKLLGKLNEDYVAESNDLENKFIKRKEQYKNIKEELDDLEEQINSVKQRIKKKNSGAQEYELFNQRKVLREKITKKRKKTVKFNIKLNKIKNSKIELKNNYEKNQYYISNAYNMRYQDYSNTIKERLTLTDFNLNIVPFDSIKKNLEG